MNDNDFLGGVSSSVLSCEVREANRRVYFFVRLMRGTLPSLVVLAVLLTIAIFAGWWLGHIPLPAVPFFVVSCWIAFFIMFWGLRRFAGNEPRFVVDLEAGTFELPYEGIQGEIGQIVALQLLSGRDKFGATRGQLNVVIADAGGLRQRYTLYSTESRFELQHPTAALARATGLPLELHTKK